jgi:hypothetical protein
MTKQPNPQPRTPPPPPKKTQVTFIGARRHIRSPYLRSKLSEVLHAWLPQGDATPGFRRGCVFVCVVVGCVCFCRVTFVFGGTFCLHKTHQTPAPAPNPETNNSPQPRGQPGAGAMAHLFEGHPLVARRLVPALLGLYSDIEYTER